MKSHRGRRGVKITQNLAKNMRRGVKITQNLAYNGLAYNELVYSGLGNSGNGINELMPSSSIPYHAMLIHPPFDGALIRLEY